MKNSLVLISFLFLFFGCASTPPIKKADFNRGTESDKQFEMDIAACDMEGNKFASSRSNSDYQADFNSMVESCMRSKGYTLK